MRAAYMLANEELFREKDPRLVTNTAMNVFFRITGAWGLKPQGQKVLLGDPPNSTFYKWRNGEGPVLSRDTLERVSYVMGIYKALRVLFSTGDAANGWPRKPNSECADQSAPAVRLGGSIANLSDVRR